MLHTNAKEHGSRRTPSPRRPLLSLGLSALLIGLLGLLVGSPVSSANDDDEPRPTVVLVHGAWADASGWSDVVKRLQKEGYPVIAPANPLRSLDGDSAYLASVLAQTPGDIILVGHSYGGAVITNAAAGNTNVKALVYVAGFVPEIGEDILHLTGADSLVPASIEFKQFPPGGPNDIDIYIIQDKFREVFAGDLSRRDAATLAATQRPLAAAGGAGLTQAAAWKEIPSWYLVATEDETITPDSQRFMAERAGAEIVEVKSSHVAMISRPGAVVDLIEAAAGGDEDD